LRLRVLEEDQQMKTTGLLVVLFLMLGTAPPASGVDALDRMNDARDVLIDIMHVTEDGIPRHILDRAHCVVIVPAAKKAGLGIGGQYGVGVALCRAPDNFGWSAPSTVKLEGGSFGAQIGAGATDIVMMIMNRTGANKLMKSKFTIGGEASAMAGPVGRAASADTDVYLRAEILTYSRARGLFIGAVIKGSTLRPVGDSNYKIYGRKVKHADILNCRVQAPPSAWPLIETLTRYSTSEI
jgi:lipid-binding SYLF domain-containing protein